MHKGPYRRPYSTKFGDFIDTRCKELKLEPIEVDEMASLELGTTRSMINGNSRGVTKKELEKFAYVLKCPIRKMEKKYLKEYQYREDKKAILLTSVKELVELILKLPTEDDESLISDQEETDEENDDSNDLWDSHFPNRKDK